MHPITDERLKKKLVALTNSLGITYQTMSRYINSGKFRLEIALKIEELTKGKITAVSLRPDCFIPTQAQRILLSQCVNHFVDHIEEHKHALVIAILNFFESQQPELYREAIDKISDMEGGQWFVAQRLAHRQDDQI